MKYLKLFEEYKYFKIRKKSYFDDNEDNIKDPNEPFFNFKKKKKKKDDQMAINREEYRRMREEQNNRYNEEVARRNKEKRDAIKKEKEHFFLNKKPLIEKLIKTIKDNPEEIFKCKYVEKKLIYAILLKDKTLIVSYFDKFRGNKKCVALEINREKIPFYVEEKYNKEMDPLGEDNWSDDEKPIAEQLGDLVREYVLNNEIILYEHKRFTK